MMTLKKSVMTLTLVTIGTVPFLAVAQTTPVSKPQSAAGAPTPTIVKSPIKPGVLSCGVGACFQYAAKKYPGVEGHSGCDSLPGRNGWQSQADDVNHSWDTNCDGKVDKELLSDSMYIVSCTWRNNACSPNRVAPVGQTPVCGSVWMPVTCPTVGGQSGCTGKPLGGKITQRCM
ncbi:MAG: hypothetical protein ABI183_17160 [Polyangiaceae bacterium]